MKRERYPDDWDDISKRIRERDGQRCTVCGVANGAMILRSVVDASKYLVLADDGAHYTSDGQAVRLSELPAEFEARQKYTRVILTVHHKGVARPDGTPGDRHDKMDVRNENLTSLCQRCHFLADIDIHIVEARAARLANLVERAAKSGQPLLF